MYSVFTVIETNQKEILQVCQLLSSRSLSQKRFQTQEHLACLLKWRKNVGTSSVLIFGKALSTQLLDLLLFVYNNVPLGHCHMLTLWAQMVDVIIVHNVID